MGIWDKWLWWKGRRIRPGRKCPLSGQYTESHTGKQTTAVEGHHMPPTSQPGAYWVLTDRTRHIGDSGYPMA